MTFLEALILGIIQGLTEFLPVSSSGHLELGSYLLGTESSENLLFAIMVHGATALSTLVVYRKDIWKLLKGLFAFQWNDETRYCLYIALSMIPVGLVGVLFEDQIEAFFGGNIIWVGAMLLVTAALLAFTFFSRKNHGEVNGIKSIVIGIAQTIAIMPGISRSGATISAALLLGIDKEKAAKFSFLMVLPPILGAMLLKTKDLIGDPTLIAEISVASILVGFLAAFFSGLLACRLMIKLVKRGKLIYFSIYCAVVGMIAVLVGLYV